MKKAPVIVIAGPTASGKTGLSVEIAKKLGGEIVSADSMQIYRGMDIATAKPSEREKQGVPHHLMDFAEMNESFSVAKYKQLAEKAIDGIISRGNVPIVVGGTGLYIDALLKNTVFVDGEKDGVREKLSERLSDEGIDSMFGELSRLDPETAGKLHKNDEKRIVRALELYYSTGKTMTEQREQSHLEKSKYDFCVIVLNAHDRQVLYDRINLRVDRMLKDGLIEEARAFFQSPVSSTARQAIGYKELLPYFEGSAALDTAVEKLKMETRRYAKRQLTWFRKTENVKWLYIDEKSDKTLTQRCLEIIEKFEGDRNEQKQE